MKSLYFILITITSLYLSTSSVFAATASECADLTKNSSGKVDIWELGNLTNFELLIECASPDAAKTQSLSPLDIFQLIIGAIAYLAFALSILAGLVGIIQIATSMGDKTKFQNATTLTKNAALAFIISLSAYAILNLVLNQIGFNLVPSGGSGGGGQGPTPTGATTVPTIITASQLNCANGTANINTCKNNWCQTDSNGSLIPGGACRDAILDETGYPTGFKNFCEANCQ